MTGNSRDSANRSDGSTVRPRIAAILQVVPDTVDHTVATICPDSWSWQPAPQDDDIFATDSVLKKGLEQALLPMPGDIAHTVVALPLSAALGGAEGIPRAIDGDNGGSISRLRRRLGFATYPLGNGGPAIRERLRRIVAQQACRFALNLTDVGATSADGMQMGYPLA